MTRKSWQLDRRTVLKGMAATLPLPLLDSMVWGSSAQVGSVIANSKKRFCTFYFPFGVPAPPDGHRHENWSWNPKEEQDGSYAFRDIMSPLNGLKGDVSVVSGLSHIRKPMGHNSGDGFLTSTPAAGIKVKNSISLDQLLADHLGDQTRFKSLVMGLDGGVGAPGRSHTLSYNKDGLPLPAQSSPRRIFDSMFSVAAQEKKKAQLAADKSILDDLLESSKALKTRVGKQDRAKLEEYLSSIRDLEQRIQREEAWLGRELPELDSSELALEATLNDPEDYLQAMFDLLFLAFQTDMTRFATFQLGCQKPSAATHQIGIKLAMQPQHGLAHSMNKDDGAANYGKYLQYITGLYARFLQRLKDTEEDSGTMLDHTLSLFGSSNSIGGTHGVRNLPLIVSGGQAFGFKQGQYLKYNKGGSDMPLTNLYATMVRQLGLPQDTFADSTGHTSELLKS